MKKVFSRNWPLLLFQNTFKSSQRAKTKLFSRAKYPQARWSLPKIIIWGEKWLKALKSLPTTEFFLCDAEKNMNKHVDKLFFDCFIWSLDLLRHE